MTKTNTRSRIVSILLVLMMLLTMVPITGVTAFAAAYNSVGVNNVVLKDGYYLETNGATEAKKGANTVPATYVAWYKNGVLTLKGYNGKDIETQGAAAGELTVKLIGTNSINNGGLVNNNGGDITVTSDSSGTLSISKTTIGSNPAIGIEAGLSSSYRTGKVTIKGSAKVTINMTHNGTSGYEKAYGIFAKENITISENASVDITCATPNNTTGGGNCNGLYAAKDVTIDTNGTIKIDVTNAGKDKDNGYSYGVYHMGTATLTKVGNMEVQWKKEGNNTRYSGGAFTRGATFSDTDHAINEDTTNCYASYRYGTSYYTVTVKNGTLTGPGVKYANGSGYFLAGDKVNITPATKEGRSGEEIPFKEWTSSDVMLDKSATTASNSFTVPGKDVTVTATHSPFVGTPTFTPIGTTGTQGTLTFKTVVKADDAYEGFRLVKEGDENNESSYISIRSDTTSTSSPYEYSHRTSIYDLDEGNYYVVAYLGNQYYLGEKVTVNYTVPVTTYTVSFDANGGTGTMADVTGVTGSYTLPACTFTAPSDKQFKGWSTSASGAVITGTSITVSADTTLYAIWEPIPATTYSLTTQVNGGHGTISASKTGLTAGSTETITFTPEVGYEIDTVTVNGTATSVSGNTLNVTMNENKTVVVTYKAIEYNITVTDGKATIGAGSGISKAAQGTTVTLTANAAPDGKVFDKWVVESGSITLADVNSATTTFTMPASAVSVKATYKNTPVTTYSLTTQVNGGHGTISASKTGLAAGSTETVIFTPDAGYKIDTVTVNGVETGVLSNVLDVTMDADKTVVVTYKAIPHTHTYGSEWKNDADNHWHECACGDKKDTAAHTAGEWIIDTPATATTSGSKHKECTVCGYTMATETIPATGGSEHSHSYVSKVTKAATTTEEGITTYTCSKCGHSYTQTIAKIKSDDSSKGNDKDNGTSIKPYIKGESGKEGWDVIKPELEEAKSGDTVTVAMNGTTVVPKDILDSIKGKDVTLVLDMENGISWKINGKEITDAAGDIDFDVTVGADAGKSIPVDVINNVTGERYSMNLTLAYDGEFGFTATLTVNMESKNAGLYANLFYYNEQTGELEFISAGQINADGNVELEFTHASDYTIVVDAKIMSDNGQADNKADETIPAPKTDDSTSKYAWNNTIIIIIGICIILIVFGAVIHVRKKDESKEE